MVPTYTVAQCKPLILSFDQVQKNLFFCENVQFFHAKKAREKSTIILFKEIDRQAI